MNALKAVYETTENIVAMVVLGLLFIGLVFWVAAKPVIVLVASITVWAIGAFFIVLLIVGLLLVIGWTRKRLAENKRDMAQINRDTILADVEARSAIVDLDAKVKAIPLLLNQLATGRALPSGLAGITSSAYPLPVIKHYEDLLPGPPMPDLVRIEDYVKADSVSLQNLFLGIGPYNEQIRGSLFQLSHIGNAGTSQWGKSNFLQNLLYQILLASEPTELYLSDLGGTSFVDFGIPYADTIESTEKLANYLWEIAQERKALYQKTGIGIKGLAHYNQVTGANLPYVVFACDEVTVAFSESKKLERILTHLVTFAAKYGIQIILSGQNWKSTSVDSTLRDQFSSRFQFKAMDRHQATMLIADSKAQDITTKGRCFCWIPERGEVIQVQTPYVSSEVLQTVSKPVHPVLTDNLPVWDMTTDEPEPEPELSGYTPDEKSRIVELFNAGDNITTICTQIHGYKNQKRIEAIKAVLRENDLIG